MGSDVSKKTLLLAQLLAQKRVLEHSLREAIRRNAPDFQSCEYLERVLHRRRSSTFLCIQIDSFLCTRTV